ncbi:MAG: methylisocitrate lyase [Gammaproteobacteria bacterium]|nr:methylisocitrate lyase [Gammaproteobacteria bacterium]MDH3371935.1 methylisocitrate lyase [Gammaproteobacteria bacterium]MDH3407736.1 methylisocitrate lyase [Gammaproteobacteria bacterium]MDH3551675.1 methylisocitrate lyase [Gammaproteobacteria bacterium]
MGLSAGKLFRQALAEETPLQIAGTINAYAALMAQQVGFRSIYLSGAGVANASYGLPDLGMTSLDNVLEDAGRITDATDLPLLVDIDTGWGGAFNIARSIRAMEKAGVAAVHIEDQIEQKRCGHRPNKNIVSPAEMIDRIRAAVDARSDEDFLIMARTDALAVEGMAPMLERISAYEEAGADAIFAEAMTEIDLYRQVTSAVNVPVLANLTEFGMTPMYTTAELASVDIRMALYPLSAFRAMNNAALNVFRALRNDGTQKNVIDIMQTRDELYEYLGYHDFEQKLDALFGKKEPGR